MFLLFKQVMVCCCQQGISSMEGTKAQVHSSAGLCQGQAQAGVFCATGCKDLVKHLQAHVAVIRLFRKAGRR